MLMLMIDDVRVRWYVYNTILPYVSATAHEHGVALLLLLPQVPWVRAILGGAV